MLILAGVSLSLVLGDNGIITRAQDAVTKYKEAEAEEQWQMDNFMANYEGGDAYARALQQKGLSATATENGYLAAEDAGDGKNVILYHYDSNGNVTETETLAYAPIELFEIDPEGPAIIGINMDYGGDGSVYYEQDKGIHLGNIVGTLVLPKEFEGSDIYSVNLYSSSAECGLCDIDTIIVPNGVDTIEDSCFKGCRFLNKLLLPSKVYKIGEYAFQYCSINKITIPDGVWDMGERCFCSSKLESFSFPRRM